MCRNKLSLLYIIQFFVLTFVPEIFGITTITADNPNFQYTGRIDFSVPNMPVIYWPGSYITVKFQGPIVMIILDDQTGQSYYNAFIDSDYENPRVIDCVAGNHVYLVSAALTDTVHTLLITRRTEASTGPTKFIGIQLNDGRTVVEPPSRPEHKILFYGNSITCGMGNEAPDNSNDNNMAHENNFLAYGSVASRLLNADYMCTAKSGIGVMISWFDMVMSEYFYRLNPDDSLSSWDFSEFIPDVVVINLMQNDSWLIGNINPIPDSSQIVSAYVDFVRVIRVHHPGALIICALGSMDATKIGSPWPGYIQSAVDYMQSTYNDTSLATYFFPFDPSWTKHPRVRHHLVMGQNLANYINEKMGWLTDIEEDNYFTQLPANFVLQQNYPNPFNPSTEITFEVKYACKVSLFVYDILGNLIKVLIDEEMNQGKYKVKFNADNISSGVYFYKIQTDNYTEVKKMMLLR